MKIKNIFKKIKKRTNSFLNRRVHRSFRKTSKYDKKQKINLPGNIKFTKKVIGLLWVNKRSFLLLALFYGLLTFLLIGMASQEIYSSLKIILDETSGGLLAGAWGEVGKAGLLFMSALTGDLSDSLSEAQQIYAGLLLLLTWLSTVFLLRNILANRKIKLRDALYSSGSPILPTFLVSLLILVQLIPIVLAMFGYAAAVTTGLLDSGVEAMLFWIVVTLLSVLSIYWIVGTIFALVVVTLPGMYPMQAIKIAGDMTNGRRLSIIYRLSWMLIFTFIVWAVITIPMILFDQWVKGVWTAISAFPTIPILILLLSTFSVIWISSYIYLLYREVVDNDPEIN